MNPRKATDWHQHPVLQSSVALFIRPHKSVDAHERMKTSIYLLLLLCIIAALLVYVGFMAAYRLPAFALLSLGIITGLYVLARTGFYELSKILVIPLFSILSLILLWFASAALHYATAWLTIPGLVAFAWLTHSRTVAAITTFTQVLAFIAIILIQSHDMIFTLNAILLTALLPVTICSVLFMQDYYSSQLNEQTLQSNSRETQFRQILDNIPAMISIRSAGKLLYINQYGTKVAGKTEDECLEQPFQNIFEIVKNPDMTDVHHDFDTDDVKLQYRLKSRHKKGLKMTELATPISYQDQIAILGVAISESVVARTVWNTDQATWHRHLTKAISESVYIINLEDDSIQISNFAGNLPGFDRHILHLLITEKLDPPFYAEDRVKVRAALRKIRQNVPVQFQHQLHYDNHTCTLEHHWQPVTDASGQVIRFYGQAQDKTDQVYLEEALRVHLVQQAVIAELGLLALSDPEPLHLLTHSTTLCQQILQLDACEILLYDEDQDTFSLAASTLIPHDDLQHTHTQTYDESPLAHIILNRDPVILDDEILNHLPEYLQQNGVQAGLSVPIRGQNRNCGILNIYAQQANHHFNNDDLYFMQSIANILGTYLEHRNIRAAELQQRRYAVALQDMIAVLNSQRALPDVLDIILERVARIVPAHEASTIFLRHHEDENMLYCVSSRGFGEAAAYLESASFPLEGTLIPTIITARHPVIIPDVATIPEWVQMQDHLTIRSYLGAAIYVNDHCIGILNVDSTEVNAFTEEDASRLETFVHHIGIAIQNARQHEILERRVEERTLALQQRQEQIQAILNATGEGIFYTEGDYIRMVNDEFCRITGFNADDLINRPSAFLRPADLTEDELQKFLNIKKTCATRKYLARRCQTQTSAARRFYCRTDTGTGR